MSDAALDVAPVSVWVQLLVGEERQGQSFCIKSIPRNVNALKNAVKDNCTVLLQHCATPMLHVFAPGADPKTERALDPGDPVPGDTSSKNPLIVVAPKHHQQQTPPQDGELSCCCRILVCEILFEYGNASFLAYLEFFCLFLNILYIRVWKNPFCYHRCADSLSTRS
jgi:hypothetical protein